MMLALCERCFDRYYVSCTDFGRVIHQDDACYVDEDDDEPRCYSCHARHEDECVIHNYSYKPEPIFYGQGRRYFGVELEIDGAGERNRNASQILSVANGGEERAYVKRDNSLRAGFELVTHPMSLSYHLNQMPWEEMLSKARQLGYLSHQSGTCGLHVHVNRDAFGDTEEAQDEVIARILYFFEKHWDELLKFSRRTRKQLQQWADRYGLKEHPKDISTGCICPLVITIVKDTEYTYKQTHCRQGAKGNYASFFRRIL